MASPQKENGFTPIANEILDKIVNTTLLGAEFQVLLFIIRKTYGYQKKSDRISLTQFEKGTGLSRPTVVKTIKNLMAKGLIVKICLPGGDMGYTFIKDHENWVVKTHLLVKGKWVTSKDVFTKTSKDVLTHKRKKEIYTKEIGEHSSQVNDLINLFKEVNPNYEQLFKNTNQRKSLERLLKKNSYEQLSKMIKFLEKSNQDKFAPIITTPSQLESKLGQLLAWAQKKKNNEPIIL